MTAERTIIAMPLLAIALLATACLPAKVPEAKPTATSAPTATAAPVATGELLRPTATRTLQPIVTSTPEATSFEEDCMALCHIPSPNESFGAGAKPLPANHVDRTVCLTCHTTAAAPALPATHLGRLDEACRGCHK